MHQLASVIVILASSRHGHQGIIAQSSSVEDHQSSSEAAVDQVRRPHSWKLSPSAWQAGGPTPLMALAKLCIALNPAGSWQVLPRLGALGTVPIPCRSNTVRMLNRLLLEPNECTVLLQEDESGGQHRERLVARLSAEDPRTVQVREHIKALDGDFLRAGVLDGGATDEAVVRWIGSNDDAKNDTTALHLELGSTDLLQPIGEQDRPRIDVILAMPRPLVFQRMIPELVSMGIGTLWVTGAQRIDKNYFSSHLLKTGGEEAIRKLVIWGLEQSGDTAIPRVVLCRSLPNLLRREISALCTDGPVVCLACHPERENSEEQQQPRVHRIREVLDQLPPGARVLMAIGPERGWEEPEELEMLVEHGFQLVTLGRRTLRTDVAAIALIAVAQECLAAQKELGEGCQTYGRPPIAQTSSRAFDRRIL